MPVSVIIPAKNEEDRIVTAIESAYANGAAEVIVADGGSEDRTVARAEAAGARVIEGETVRARQLNRGAELARHDILLFLHADTTLPAGALTAVGKEVGRGTRFGGFRLRFHEPARGLRFIAFMVNLRTAMTRAPWGDQAQFAHRATFFEVGGYREIPLMEDYELAWRMRRRTRVAILPLQVETSGRRFLEKGIVRTTVTNWLIIAAWHLGISPERLARWYRGS